MQQKKTQLSLQCQLQNSGSFICSHTLFCLRLSCAFFHFQQHIFVRQGLQFVGRVVKYRNRFGEDYLQCVLANAAGEFLI